MPFLAYFAVLIVAVGSVLFGLDLLTAPLPPSNKPTIHTVGAAPPPNPMRQIPIGRVTAHDDAQKDKQLTPVHPAAPGNPLKEAARNAEKLTPPPAAPAKPAEAAPPPAAAAPATPAPQQAPPEPTQQAASPAPQPAPVSQPSASTQTANAQVPNARPNSCNLQACAVAYKSFRAEDCTYQPYDGPRRLCESPPVQSEQTALRPRDRIPAAAMRDRGPVTLARDRRGNELDDVAREVRQLSRRDAIDVEDDGPVVSRRRGVVILREPDDEDDVVLRLPAAIGR